MRWRAAEPGPAQRIYWLPADCLTEENILIRNKRERVKNQFSFEGLNA